MNTTDTNPRRWLITAGVMTGMFLAALEATVIGTAMPTIVGSLGGMQYFSWVFSAYLLTSTVSGPIWGRLSDLFGRKILYQVSIVVFIAGSVMCGFSQSMTQLVISRAVQGIGAGGLVPLGMTIIGDTFTLRERARVQALFSGVWGLSSVAGPFIGGFLTDQLSWRWVFHINVPIGIAAAIIMGLALERTAIHTRPVIDYTGAFLFTGAVTLLMYGVVDERLGAGELSLRTGAILVSAFVLLAVFVFYERRTAEPIIPMRLFRNRIVSIAVACGFLSGVAMFGAISFIPLFAQAVRGSSATEAGSLLTPLMLSWVAISIAGTPLMLRVPYRAMIVFGLMLISLSFFSFSTFDDTTAYTTLLIVLMTMGAGLGFAMLTLLIVVQHSVARADLGISTSLNQFARSVGGAIGVALMGAILTAGLMSVSSRQSVSMNELVAARPAASRGAVDPLRMMRHEVAGALHNVFRAGGVVAAVAMLLALMLPGGKLEQQ